MTRKSSIAKRNLGKTLNHVKAFLDEFKTESDRAAVILGAAKLDNILYQIFCPGGVFIAQLCGQDETPTLSKSPNLINPLFRT